MSDGDTTHDFWLPAWVKLTPAEGGWCHLAVVHDSSGTKYFVNGNEQKEESK